MTINIKVSVCVVTYNQEKYIAECLKSLIEQETDFSFEIIVGEDNSCDGTRAIVNDFAKKNSNLIVKNYHNVNVGALKNAVTSYKLAKGKYICHMDGDDRALPGKLQSQFDILEKNPGCAICSHDMLLINSNGDSLERSFKKYKEGICTLMDLYKTLPFFAHSSKMFRNDLDDKYWCSLHPKALDIEIHVEQAKKGDIYHIGDKLGVYRSGVGVSSMHRGVNPLLPAGMDRIFKGAMLGSDKEITKLKSYYSKVYLNYAYQSAVANNKNDFRIYIKQSMRTKIISIQQIIIGAFYVCPYIFLKISQFRNKLRYRRSF